MLSWYTVYIIIISTNFLVRKFCGNVQFSQSFGWIAQTLHKKFSFPLRISSVNVTKSATDCGLGHIYGRDPEWKTLFVQWKLCGNCAFPRNFYTRKLDKITVFYAVEIFQFSNQLYLRKLPQGCYCISHHPYLYQHFC